MLGGYRELLIVCPGGARKNSLRPLSLSFTPPFKWTTSQIVCSGLIAGTLLSHMDMVTWSLHWRRGLGLPLSGSVTCSKAPEPSPLSRSWISGWRSLEYKTLKCSSQVPMDASVFPLIDVFTVDSVDISGAPTGLGGRNTRWVTAGACPGGDAWGGEEWELDFYVGSPWGCILQENSTEGLRYFSCCSTNRFLFQSRSFFGSFLLRLGAPWFHNSFPVKAPTFRPYWMVIVCIPWRYDVTCKTPLLPRGLTWQTSGCKFWRLWLWYNES